MATIRALILSGWLLAGAGLITPAALVSAGMAAQPAVQRLVIIDGETTRGWAVTEATLEPSSRHARSGKALLFHIPVDWHAGEPKYPIGWPRCWLKLPEDKRDWSAWDLFRFWVYTDTSRDELPARPFYMIISTASHRNAWQRDLDAVRKGQWVLFEFPVDQIPGREQVVEIKFVISEAYYRHGDVVDFYIDDFELVRYLRPTPVRVRLASPVWYCDARSLPIFAQVLGVKPGQAAGIDVELRRGGKVVARARLRAERGENRLCLPLPRRLKPGRYTVRVGSGEAAVELPLELMQSPWQGR